MTDRETPVTKPESALDRIRKERCPNGCGKGLLIQSLGNGRNLHEMGLLDGEVWFDCECPSAEQLVEELDKQLAQRDEQILEVLKIACRQLAEPAAEDTKVLIEICTVLEENVDDKD